MTRNRLPNRRRSETREIIHNGGHKLTLSVGFYDDGRFGECFVASSKIGTELEATARDSAILISLLLQNQVALTGIAHSLTINPDGSPSSVVGTVVNALLEYEGRLLALLLPTDFDAAKTRRHLFGGWLTKRCVWFPRTDGKREAPKENTSWYVWQAHDGPPVLLYGPNELRTLSTKPGSTGSS